MYSEASLYDQVIQFIINSPYTAYVSVGLLVAGAMLLRTTLIPIKPEYRHID
jgi:hypothetical protein